MRGTIGILGGMGPEATSYLYDKIIKSTPAKKDQDHVPIVIFNNPQIPDRTEAILHNGETPVNEIVKTAHKLEEAGADFIVMPCNTSHYFIKEISSSVRIPIVDMIFETFKFIREKYPDVKKIGLLATNGTVQSRIYHKIFEKSEIEVLDLAEFEQEVFVMDSIYGDKGIKAGRKKDASSRLLTAVNSLKNNGAELIIMGCTEIPLVLKQKLTDAVLIDPMKIIAEKSVLLSKAMQEKVVLEN